MSNQRNSREHERGRPVMLVSIPFNRATEWPLMHIVTSLFFFSSAKHRGHFTAEGKAGSPGLAAAGTDGTDDNVCEEVLRGKACWLPQQC